MDIDPPSADDSGPPPPPLPPPPAATPGHPHFPAHSGPRVWFLDDGLAPISLALTRLLLAHGDAVVAGVVPGEYKGPRGEAFRAFVGEVGWKGGRKERFRAVALDARSVALCQAAVAEALRIFGRVDIVLLCRSEALIGAVEEMGQDARAVTLVREQLETNFFGHVNLVRACLPSMRARRSGHFVAVTGITGHLGTPGLGMYCSSQWALEGFCDSLAYEIAPFNIKMTIVQPNLEIQILTNKITAVPPLPPYAPDVNPAPLTRDIIAHLLDRLDDAQAEAPAEGPAEAESPPPAEQSSAGAQLRGPGAASLYAPLGAGLREELVAETVYALAAIGGHENPPARHIVSFEGVTSVKEKLKTVSEELEDFIEVSGAVDIARDAGEGGVGWGV
ncbi:short chain dehydrogenase/reductase family protein-like protein [Trichodelitschia bisporula]|uniref:Short chain dehydrogenase/reductase family protein-like protein n=1 Tax=Trichodelitschia bisporula TaxID=703511 RepID=A0A6G1HN30_9PEZI|nr:short chain dehydrogenase/reductase family protein-like protein [Trichodelitschia bisporula]